MKKHLIAGVLGLAMLLVAVSTPHVNAGDAKGECCILIDGACVPCDKMASTDATCDPGQCKTMTPEQCKSLGCEPAQCNETTATLSSAKAQAAGKRSSESGCEPESNCATKNRCGGGGCAMKMVKVQDAKSGEATSRLVPVNQQATTVSKTEIARPGPGI